MVDAPAPIVLKGAPEVIPVGVLHTVRMKLAEDVDKSPVTRVLVGIARINVEVDVIDAAVGMVHVDRLGSDVQIPQPNGGLGRIEVLLEITMDALEPLELQRVFIRRDFITL